MKNLLTGLKTIFKNSTYIWIALGTTVLVGYASYWLLYQTTTIPTFLANMKNGDFGRYSYWYGITYLVTSILIIVFAGVSVAGSIWLFRHSKLGRATNLWANAGGLAAAMLGMGCPVCGAFLLSLLGVAGGLSIFPLQGLELKLLSLLLLTASIIYSARKSHTAVHCTECDNITHHEPGVKSTSHHIDTNITPYKTLTALLTILFIVNQLYIGRVAATVGVVPDDSLNIIRLFSVKPKSTLTVIAPKLNADGKTTTLTEFTTITPVPGNPRSGDVVADAKTVMFPTGKPFYAPDDISFDDPTGAQSKWGAFEKSITLSGDLQARYEQLTNAFTCNYCCGGPNNVTPIAKCGCKHAKAWRGMFKYMLQTYGSMYTNDQLMGEAYRWTGIWYPKGVLEDYLLATGNGNVLGHETHGGAGTDGRHGYVGK